MIERKGMVMKLKVDRNSMLLWYPRVKDLAIPQPKTKMIYFGFETMVKWIEAKIPDRYQEIIYKAVEDKFPVFLRTDLASGKHSWEKTCFVASKDLLMRNIGELLVDNAISGLVGLRFNALVFREYIEMDSRFTAFWGKLPIGAERRYFVRNGRVEEHFPYWPEEAITDASIGNWKEVLAELNREDEVELLTDYAGKVGSVLDGYWSIDFCRGRDLKWYLIDCAAGDDSWHPNRKQNESAKCPIFLKRLA